MELTSVKNKEESTSAPLNLVLQLKWEREVSKLQHLLKQRLQRDMQKLFEDKGYSNIVLVINDGVEIECHSAILKTRTPRFYRLCCEFGQLHKQNSPGRINLREVNETELYSFLREVYCGENMETLENSMIERLQAVSIEADSDDTLQTASRQNANELDDEIMSESFPHSNSSTLIRKSKENTVEDSDVQNLLDFNVTDNMNREMNLYKSDKNVNPLNTCDITNAIDLDTAFLKDLGASASLNFQSINLPKFENTGCDKDLINFDESDRYEITSEIGESQVSNANGSSSIVEYDLPFESNIETAKSTKMVLLDSECVKSDHEDSLLSVLKTSAGQEALELKLGSKEGQVMVHSHDSGMCSESRKLSTSSVGHPTFSPCSENAVDNSSNESLPKDDSLECCLDSLANDEMNESLFSVFGGLNSTDNSTNNINREYPNNSNVTAVDNDVSQMSASFPITGRTNVELCSWKSVFARKHSRLDNDDGISPKLCSSSVRRWSLSSGESASNSKPAAIVLPYNANADLLMNTDPSVEVSEQPQNRATSLAQVNLNNRTSLNLVSFVPYLREEHHIESPQFIGPSQISHDASSINDSFSGPITSIENTTQEIIPNIDTNSSSVLNVTTSEIRQDMSEQSDTSSGVFPNNFAEGDASTGLVSVGNSVTSVDIIEIPIEMPEALSETKSGGGHPPPPVYMYIEAECHSPSNSRPRSAAGKGHSRMSENFSRGVPLRRKVFGSNSLLRRPKSETSASLFPHLDDGIRKSRCADKRISLRLDDDDAGSTHSLEGPSTMLRYVGEACSKLGDDLLKMFLNKIDSDVTIVINGKEIKAHKSVLSSRCIYFAAAMSGNWVESSGNVINMSGFSYEAVHFAIYHIYSGASVIPENIEISELASLADMLGFEGLKDVVALAMKMKYCHFFHKPCSGCSTTVSECLLIAASFGLDELQEKCLKWINKHMLKTWPTKSFAALPEELLQKCLNALKLDISTETVLDLTVRCEKLSSTLPRIKWVEPVASLARQLSETCASFLAENLAGVLGSQAFLDLRTGHTWTIHVTETSLLIATESISLIGACKAYVKIHALKNYHELCKAEETELCDVNENFELLINKIHRQVEHFLIHNANRVVRCSGWNLLTSDLQQRIKDAAVIVFEFGKPTAAPPKLSSQNKKFTRPRTSCSSTASDSPVNWRNKVGVNSKALSKSLHLTLEERSSAKNSGRTFDRAATLPRTLATKSASVPRKDESQINSNKLKSMQSIKPTTNNAQSLKQTHTNPPINGNGAQRPKSLTLRERSSSVTTAKVRDKPVTKELVNSSKSLIPNSISLRTAIGTSSKYSANCRPRPSSYNGVTRTVKAPTNGSFNGKDLSGKENKGDTTKSGFNIRSKSDENSKTATRNLGKTPLARGSTSVKV